MQEGHAHVFVDTDSSSSLSDAFIYRLHCVDGFVNQPAEAGNRACTAGVAVPQAFQRRLQPPG